MTPNPEQESSRKQRALPSSPAQPPDRLRDGKASWKQGACSAPPLASTGGEGIAAPRQVGAGGGGDASGWSCGGVEGGAVTSGEPYSSRGTRALQTDGTRPQVRPIYARTPTHARTHAGGARARGPAAKSARRGRGGSAGARAASRRGARPFSRPISAPAAVPRARGPPRADSRDSGGGARPACEEAEGERRVPGPGCDCGRERRHYQHRVPAKLLSRVGALSVALHVATPRGEARSACAVPSPCAGTPAPLPGRAAEPRPRRWCRGSWLRRRGLLARGVPRLGRRESAGHLGLRWALAGVLFFSPFAWRTSLPLP